MSFLQNGSAFTLRDAGNDVPRLPAHVYTVEPSDFGLFLRHQQDEFTFPYKLYGSLDNFAERVATTYRATQGNLGILLNGIKGTGKTVQAEQICNLLELPVILVTNDFEGELVPFLNRIPDDIVVLIDEYEKIYKRSNALLSVMDGALRTKHRRVFLLTTNDACVSDSMLNRPSRLLYVKRFGNLEGAIIVEIVNDMLLEQEHRDAAIRFLGGLEIITVDIVKAVCAEMNRFGELPSAFKHILNISGRNSSIKTVSHLIGGRVNRIGSFVKIDPVDPFREGAIDDTFGILKDDNWTGYGEIKSVDAEEQTITTTEGTFLIEDPSVHPSLAGVAAAAY